MLYAFVGLAAGAAAGLLIPAELPAAWSVYTATGLFAMLASIVGGLRSTMAGKFSAAEFISGLVVGVLLAMAVAWLGDRLGIPGYLAAVIYFGLHIFADADAIRKKAHKKLTNIDSSP